MFTHDLKLLRSERRMLSDGIGAEDRIKAKSCELRDRVIEREEMNTIRTNKMRLMRMKIIEEGARGR